MKLIKCENVKREHKPSPYLRQTGEGVDLVEKR